MPPQGEEWRQSALADCINLFEEQFLTGCHAANRATQADKARVVASQAQQGVGW